jgi:hypothetical protein
VAEAFYLSASPDKLKKSFLRVLCVSVVNPAQMEALISLNTVGFASKSFTRATFRGTLFSLFNHLGCRL